MTTKQEYEPIFHVSFLKDGQLAKIVDWTVFEYVDRVVQRYGDNLISIGKPEGKSWRGIFGKYPLTITEHPDCKVELIPNPFKD